MEENKKPENPTIREGWTLRDEFASQAMSTILNHKTYDGQQIHELNEARFLNVYWDSEVSEKEIEQSKKCVLDDASFIAKRAYLMADAMLKQREL